MRFIAKSAIGAAVIVSLLAFGSIASAQGPSKCISGKNKCASKKAAGILKCWIAAEKDGVAVEQECIDKARNKFGGLCDGGINEDQGCDEDADCPGSTCEKGCFTKLEAKDAGSSDPLDTCLTAGDAAAIEAKVDAFVDDVVSDLDPFYPGVSPASKCDAGKKKCVSKKMAALLKCHGNAVKNGDPLDQECIDKAHSKFGGVCDGGVNEDQICLVNGDCPGSTCVKGCFTKLEAKDAGSSDPLDTCHTAGNAATLESKVDAFVSDVLCELGFTTLPCGPPVLTPTPTPTLTPTPTATATFVPGTIFQGAISRTIGQWTYNAVPGLAGGEAECNNQFAGSHVCTYTELSNAEALGELVGAIDVNSIPVDHFWAVIPGAADIDQCITAPPGTPTRWAYATAHTASKGNHAALNNGTGDLGPVLAPVSCNSSMFSVGCCL